MRKLYNAATVLALAALAVFVYMYTTPKQYNLALPGVKYRLGEEHGEAQPATLRINGKLQQRILGSITFRGTIDIEGEDLPVPQHSRELSFKIDDRGEGYMLYHIVEGGHTDAFLYGGIFFGDDLKQATIWFPDRSTDGSRTRWSTVDGHMFSAPAKNKEEALKISNELMKGMLGERALK